MTYLVRCFCVKMLLDKLDLQSKKTGKRDEVDLGKNTNIPNIKKISMFVCPMNGFLIKILCY